jgi:hypothetical protein
MGDLVERGRQFSVAVVAQPPLERIEHRVAGLPAYADDERKSEFLPVLGIEFFEAAELGVR